MRGVSGRGGRPNGMVQLLFVAVSLFAARGKGSGEGIGWFAAKRVDGVGRACVRDGSGNGRRFAPPPLPP